MASPDLQIALVMKSIADVTYTLDTVKGNFMSIPTDCPQRDERLGWTGDAHAFSPTANFLYDTAGFWRSWLRVCFPWPKTLKAFFVP